MKVAFLLLVLHSAFTGLTDDEAYYWVLSQHPAWGYAYHPPAMAWMIALFGKTLGWISQAYAFRCLLVRLPALFSGLVCLCLMSRWSSRVFSISERKTSLWIFSFAGVFSLCWMMVPDVPLLLGWSALFWIGWKIIYTDYIKEGHSSWDSVGLVLSTLLVMLSKFSGVLAVLSTAISFMVFLPKTKWPKYVAQLSLGFIIALLPILYWNSTHDWT